MDGQETAKRTFTRTIEPHVCVCRVCNGSGNVRETPCRQCLGSGRVICSSEIKTYVEPYLGE